MKRINQKGFTLLEIMGVVIIIGVLLLVAIPSVTKYINRSKLDVYKSDLKSMVTSVKNEVMSGGYDFDSDYEYLVVPVVCIDLEKGSNTKSTFGEYSAQHSFVLVEGTDVGYSFKVQALDSMGYGTALSKPELVKISEVRNKILNSITKSFDEDENSVYDIEFYNYYISRDKIANVVTCDILDDYEMKESTEIEIDPTSKNLKDVILMDNKETPDIGIDFSKISSNINGRGLYYTNKNTEGNNTTYYFRGNVDNNYVKFGKEGEEDIYWRIIRINEDGSIRLIYQGNSVDDTGEDANIGRIAFNNIGSSGDNAYVGYMYGLTGQTGENAYELTHSNDNSSTIKKHIDNWYVSNLKMNYEFYLADAGFCNDRSVATSPGVWKLPSLSDTALGYSTHETVYGPYNRLANEKQPQFKCPNASNDLFTLKGSTKGNKALDNPIGLITMDEMVFAGAISGYINRNYYLYFDSNEPFWTMSPSTVAMGSVSIWHSDSYIYNDSVYQGRGSVYIPNFVRPVINLKSTVKISSNVSSGCTEQNGTKACPYIIDTILFGDANDDGVINQKDLLAITGYLTEKREINLSASDVNLDGIIDDKDLALLRRYVSNYNWETNTPPFPLPVVE